ncbi:MAG: AMP-binding protein, partial [Actinomycetota bacterium]
LAVTSDGSDALREGPGSDDGIEWCTLDDLEARAGIDPDDTPDPDGPAPAGPHPDDLAYISFTSGSTGRPKPVGVSHANAVNYLLAFQERPGFGEGDVMLALTGLDFDIALTEIFLPLIAGGSFVVVDWKTSASLASLADLVSSSGITVGQTTPALWRGMLDNGLADQPNLRAWCGGEHLDADLAERLGANVGELWNVYGPTETTVWATASKVRSGERASIGDPVGNAILSIRSPHGMLQPPGALGELYIGGGGLTAGYIGRPEQTSAAFVPDTRRPGEMVYRSGDLVVQNEAGEIHYIGRVDNQIKLRGRRIEPGEIESVLLGDPRVRAAAVVDRDDQLVAYVVEDDAADAGPGHEPLTGDALRAGLAEVLPGSLIPAYIEVLDQLPLTRSNKVDRTALRRLPLRSAEVPYEAPRPGLEEDLAARWTAILDVDRIGRNDNFFDLGGTSLEATAIFADISQLVGRDYPIAALFQSPTIAQLAQILATEWRQATTSLIPVRASGSRRPYFSVAPFLTSTLGYKLLADGFGPSQPLYVFQPQGLASEGPIHERVEDMASHYIEEMRTVQPKGPYLLGGHCAGNWVAFEMALQLKAAGEEVETLALVDWGPPGVDSPRRRRLRSAVSVVREYWRTGRLLHALVWQARITREYLVGAFIGDAASRQMAMVRRKHAAAFAAYDPPKRYDGDVVLFRSHESIGRKDRDWHLRWRDFIDGQVRVVEVPGTHAELLLEADHAGALTAELAKVFADGDASTPDSPQA